MVLFGYHFGVDDSEIKASVFIFVFLSCMVLAIAIAAFVNNRKWGTRWKVEWQLPGSGITMAVGLIIGGFIRASGTYSVSTFTFSPAVFFVGLLPPILFNEGYHLQRQFFLSYIGAIMLLAVAGTALASTLIASMLHSITNGGPVRGVTLTWAESMSYGSLLGATDPVAVLATFSHLRVDPGVFYLVFGESVLNDAVGLTMFTISSKFVGTDRGAVSVWLGFFDFLLVFVGSMFIGIAWGCVAALVLKKFDFRSNPILELSLYTLMAYMPFLFSQVIGMSGIVTILMAGITTKHYGARNLSSAKAQEVADMLFRVLAFLADNSVFLYLGLSVFGLQRFQRSFNLNFIIWTLVTCVISRGSMVLFMCGLINLCHKFTGMEFISWRNQGVLCAAGVRGAVAVAAASAFPDKFGNRETIITTTMGAVLIMNFLVAPFTTPLIKWLKIPTHVEYDQTEAPPVSRFVAYCLAAEEEHLAPRILTSPRRDHMTRRTSNVAILRNRNGSRDGDASIESGMPDGVTSLSVGAPGRGGDVAADGLGSPEGRANGGGAVRRPSREDGRLSKPGSFRRRRSLAGGDASAEGDLEVDIGPDPYDFGGMSRELLTERVQEHLSGVDGGRRSQPGSARDSPPDDRAESAVPLSPQGGHFA